MTLIGVAVSTRDLSGRFRRESKILQFGLNARCAFIWRQINIGFSQSENDPSFISQIGFLSLVSGLLFGKAMPIVPIALNYQLLIRERKVEGVKPNNILCFRMQIYSRKSICHLVFNTTHPWHVLQYPGTSARRRTKTETLHFALLYFFLLAALLTTKRNTRLPMNIIFSWLYMVQGCTRRGTELAFNSLVWSISESFSAIFAHLCYSRFCSWPVDTLNGASMRAEPSLSMSTIINPLKCLAAFFAYPYWIVVALVLRCISKPPTFSRAKTSILRWNARKLFSTVLAISCVYTSGRYTFALSTAIKLAVTRMTEKNLATLLACLLYGAFAIYCVPCASAVKGTKLGAEASSWWNMKRGAALLAENFHNMNPFVLGYSSTCSGRLVTKPALSEDDRSSQAHFIIPFFMDSKNWKHSHSEEWGKSISEKPLRELVGAKK